MWHTSSWREITHSSLPASQWTGLSSPQPAVGVPRVVVEARVEDVDLHARHAAQRTFGWSRTPLGRRGDLEARRRPRRSRLDAPTSTSTGPASTTQPWAVDVPPGEVAEADGRSGRSRSRPAPGPGGRSPAAGGPAGRRSPRGGRGRAARPPRRPGRPVGDVDLHDHLAVARPSPPRRRGARRRRRSCTRGRGRSRRAARCRAGRSGGGRRGGPRRSVTRSSAPG